MKKKAVLLLGLVATVFISLALPVVAPGQARAQGEVVFKELNVALWPEYDRPSVLVIYRITLADNTTLPTELTLRIPATAEVNAVATRQSDGGLFNVAHTRVVNGAWAEIHFTTSMPGTQVEYYDNTLSTSGQSRTYQYSWSGDYAVDSLGIEVQQPLNATNLVTSPGLGAGKTGQDGLVYYTANIGSLPVGQGFELSLQYEKEGETLSAAGLQVQPSSPVSGTASSLRSKLRSVMPWGLLALGLILIVGGGIWYWQSGKRKEIRQPPHRRRKPAVDAREAAEPDEGYIYCHSCGKRAAPGDRFCRACGTQLRSS